ncbi:MAG TPA: hypothetical protein VJT31_24825, partial [Rugosimonospora sp.]|nr:hypothetical protein [Rugosimonospora sp.]
IGRRGNNADITAVISLGNGTVPAGVGRDGTRAEAGAGQPAAGWTLVDGEHEAEQVVPMPSDATIILPVSLADRAQWTRKSGNKS